MAKTVYYHEVQTTGHYMQAGMICTVTNMTVTVTKLGHMTVKLFHPTSASMRPQTSAMETRAQEEVEMGLAVMTVPSSSSLCTPVEPEEDMTTHTDQSQINELLCRAHSFNNTATDHKRLTCIVVRVLLCFHITTFILVCSCTWF